MWQKFKKKLNSLSKKNNGVFTSKEAKEVGISTRTFYRLHAAGKIICISRGIYQMTECNISPDYAAIKKRVPNSVICTISALYHHELTTEIPCCIHLAIQRDMAIPKIDYPAVKFYRMSPKIFPIGIEQKEIGGIIMNIYTPEKTIVDCFKYRNTLSLDLAIDSLKKYLESTSNKPSKIYEIAQMCHTGKIIKPYLEALV